MKEGYCVLDKSVIHEVLNEPNLNTIIMVHDDSSIAKQILKKYDLTARRINLSFRHSDYLSVGSSSSHKRYIFCRILKSEFPIHVEPSPITVVLSRGPTNTEKYGKLVALKNFGVLSQVQDLLKYVSIHFNESKLMPVTIPMDIEMDNHRKDNNIEFVYYYRGSEPIVPLMHNLQVTEPFTNALIGNSEATWQLLSKPQLMAKGIAIDLDKISSDPSLIDIKFPCIFDMNENREYVFQDAIDWIIRKS